MRRRSFLLGLLSVPVLSPAVLAVVRRQPEIKPLPMKEADPELAAAIKEAKDAMDELSVPSNDRFYSLDRTFVEQFQKEVLEETEKYQARLRKAFF